MDYRSQLIKMIDKFNIQSVEELREAEMIILADSKFRTIIKKKNYDTHLETLKKVKVRAQKLNPGDIDIPESDKETLQLKRMFERCLIIFSGVCDAYIQMQNLLKSKSEGAKVGFLEYKQVHNKVRFAKQNFSSTMNDLDVMYSDFADYGRNEETEELDGVEYMTYDSLK